jgi:hypothetical protein
MTGFVLHEHAVDPTSGRISSYFCQLFILLGNNSVQYCILDSDKNSFFALADYHLPEPPKSREDYLSQVSQLFSEEEALKKKYPSVLISVDSHFHTLVPSSLFEKEQARQYLDFHFSLPSGFTISHDRVPEIDACNIFAYEPALQDLIKENFKDEVITHRSTALLKAFYMQHQQNGGSSGIFLNSRNGHIDIAVFNKKKLLFFNSFSFKTKEDILYFTLYTFEQLGLQPDSMPLTISGAIDSNDETLKLLKQYIQTVEFAVLPSTFNYSPLLKQLPAHRYTELFAVALCGS